MFLFVPSSALPLPFFFFFLFLCPPLPLTLLFPTRPSAKPISSSVTLLTPFIQLVEHSDGYIGNYSAQKALLEHRGQEEFVLIFIHIQLTDTFGRLLPPPPNSRSRSPDAWVPRPSDFWPDFQVQIYDAGKLVTPY